MSFQVKYILMIYYYFLDLCKHYKCYFYPGICKLTIIFKIDNDEVSIKTSTGKVSKKSKRKKKNIDSDDDFEDSSG